MWSYRFGKTGIDGASEVDIVYSYVETNLAILQALITSGTKGIVFAGMGAGGLSRHRRHR